MKNKYTLEIVPNSELLKSLQQQIERLQEQLAEANEVIKGYSKLESLMNCSFGPTENCPSQKYIEKWGVK